MALVRRLITSRGNVLAGQPHPLLRPVTACFAVFSVHCTSLLPGRQPWAAAFSSPPRLHTRHFTAAGAHSSANSSDNHEWGGIPNFVHRHIDYANPSCQACLVPLIPDPALVPHWQTPATQPTVDGIERKPMRRYALTPLCEPCWEKAHQRRMAARKLEEEKMADRRKRLDALLGRIEGMPQGELVPIRYAAEKLMAAVTSSGHPYPGSPRPERWYRAYLRQAWDLEKVLRIEKVGTRWKCDKQRVDEMDFALHFYRHDRLIDL